MTGHSLKKKKRKVNFKNKICFAFSIFLILFKWVMGETDKFPSLIASKISKPALIKPFSECIKR